MGPARASVVAYVAPAFAVLYGVTLLGEPLTVGTVLGLGLILLGSSMAGNGRPPAPLARLARLVSRTGPSRSSVPAPGRAR
jgi:drug/metabolite transporter (DMT)-like permease